MVGQYNITSASTTIAAGTPFSLNITLTKIGVYILEVNANTGVAVLNRPIYVGGFLPLIPDFSDLTPQRSAAEIAAVQPNDLTVLRNNLLTLINQKRASWGLASLNLDNDLNSLAQGHSADMVARNFFGHGNPDGNGPQQRETLAGLNYGV